MSVKNSASKENYVRVSIWEVCKQGLKEMVQDITKFLLKPVHYASNYKVKYKVNEDFLQSLRDLHENVERLEPLSKEPLCGKKEFLQILRDILGEDKTAEYSPLILNACETKQKILPKIILSVFLTLILILALFLLKICITIIPPGSKGVLYKKFSGGTVTSRVYREGFHMFFPWNRMFVYNTRLQETTIAMNIWTSESISIRVFVSVSYHPKYEYLGFLHRDIGPDYVNTIIIPQTTGICRKMIGRKKFDEIMYTDIKIFSSLSSELSYRYIKLENFNIKKIEIPPGIQQMLTNLYQKKNYPVQFKKSEAFLNRIEGEGIRDRNNAIRTSLSPEMLKWKAIEKGINPFFKPEKKEVLLPAKKN